MWPKTNPQSRRTKPDFVEIDPILAPQCDSKQSPFWPKLLQFSRNQPRVGRNHATSDRDNPYLVEPNPNFVESKADSAESKSGLAESTKPTPQPPRAGRNQPTFRLISTQEWSNSIQIWSNPGQNQRVGRNEQRCNDKAPWQVLHDSGREGRGQLVHWHVGVRPGSADHGLALHKATGEGDAPLRPSLA